MTTTVIPQLIEKSCVRCGVFYVPRIHRQRFCSPACKDKKPRMRREDYPDNCSFEGCNLSFYSNTLCKPHNLQLWAGKELSPLKPKMSYNDEYRRITPKGYVEIYRPTHANAQKSGIIMEHVYIMSEYLQRPLTRAETVHHINLKKDDNRIENLQLRQGNHGEGSVFVCGDCHSINVIAIPIADSTEKERR